MGDEKVRDSAAERVLADQFAIIVDGGGHAKAADQAKALRARTMLANFERTWCCIH
jgi:hypothetical protein